MGNYKCARRQCGYEFDPKGPEAGSLPGVKCPKCGYRILHKPRPAIVKKYKAV